MHIQETHFQLIVIINRIVITGAATNSAWGIGSKAVFTCVAAGEWQFAMRSEAIGNGSNAVAFSTV